MSDTERPFRRPVQVLVYCFRTIGPDVEYLMLRRTARYGGFWQGVTGAPEADESLLKAAGRELLEETQFSPKALWQVDYSYCFPLEAEWKWAYLPEVKTIEEHVFLAELPGNLDPVLSSEHDQYEWACFDRSRELLRWPENRRALEFCHQLLRAGNMSR